MISERGSISLVWLLAGSTKVPSLWVWWTLLVHCSGFLPVDLVGKWFPPCGCGGHCWFTVVVPSLWVWWALLVHCSSFLSVGVVDTAGSL